MQIPFFSQLLGFYHRVLNFWTGLMSGSIGLILTAIVLLGGITDPSLQVRLFILACWAAFFLSMIGVWKKERDKADAVKEQLRIALEVKRPKLVGFIYGIVMRELVDIESERPKSEWEHYGAYVYKHVGQWVTLQVGIVNDTDTATSLLNFSLRIKTNFSQFEIPYPYRSKEPVSDDLTSFLVDGKKVAKNGKHIEGEISFQVKGMESYDSIRETTLIITDAWQNPHKIVQWGKPPFTTKEKTQAMFQVYLDELKEIHAGTKRASED